MTAYFFIFILLFVGGALSLIDNERARRSAYKVYLFFAVPILFGFAGLRAPGVDADYELYAGWFNAIKDGTLGHSPFAKDPSFALLGLGLNSMGLGIATLLAVYSALCLGSQLMFIQKAVALRWLPLGVFLMLCRFFIPHEMTQIRASIAIPLMSLAVLQFHAHKRLQGTLFMLLALCFHVSAILGLPFCIMLACDVRFRSRAILGVFTLLAILGYVAFSRVALFLAVFARTSDYVNGSYDTTTAKLLSIYLLSRVLLVACAALFLWNRMESRQRLLVVCSAFGIMLEIALSSNDSLAVRAGEIFGLFDVASALMILSYLRRRTALVYVVFLLCLGGVFFNSTTKIINPYASRLDT